MANAAGLHDDSTAELALALTLAARSAASLTSSATRIEVSGIPPGVPHWPTDSPGAAFVGYGSVGRAIVRRLLPFEARVTAVASRSRPGDELVDAVHGTDELPALLPDAEIVIVVVPLLDATRGLVDEAFLAALPTVRSSSMSPAARSPTPRRSSGMRAVCGSPSTSPIPSRSPTGIRCSPRRGADQPHVGGLSSAMRPRAIRLLRDQLRTPWAGEPPVNVVRGYPRTTRRGQASAHRDRHTSDWVWSGQRDERGRIVHGQVTARGPR